MTDMRRLGRRLIADWACGTLHGWLDGYTDPGEPGSVNDIGGQAKLAWETHGEAFSFGGNPDRPWAVYEAGVIRAEPHPPYAHHLGPDVRRFRISIKVEEIKEGN